MTIRKAIVQTAAQHQQIQAGDYVDPAGLGSGTTSSSTVLYGDSAYRVPPGAVPTGTGFTHITAGVQDAAAKLVDTADVNDAQVTLPKMANMETSSLIYRKTAAAGVPEVNTLATLKTDLGLTGTNSGDQTITLTGDVTGTGTGSFAATLVTTQPATHTWSAGQRFDGNIGQGIAVPGQINLRLALPLTGATSSYAQYSSGTIQSDVTAGGIYYTSYASTLAAAFTVTAIQHYQAAQGTIGAGSTVTNQYGFFAASSLIGATNNYGFWGQIPAAAGRWNFYGQGTALSYMAGGLLLGSTTDTGEQLQVTGTTRMSGNIGWGVAPAAANALTNSLAITGATVAHGMLANGTVQSGVTTSAWGFKSNLSTVAATFTCTSLVHFGTAQGTIGAGSTVTNQYGFYADPVLIGATNNMGFYGDISAATGRWNFYANGTALNYMNGALLIGSATDTGEKLQVTGTSKHTGAAVFNSNVTTDGGFILINRVGDAASSQVYQDTDAGFASQNLYRVGGVLRWQTLRTSAAESGADAGSNWQFAAYDDAGAALGNVYTVVRATRVLSFAVNPVVLTAAAGTNTTAAASTAYAMSAAPNASYRTLMDCSGSHTAAKVAGTYAMGQGDALAVSGTGTLYPIQTIYIAAADFPTVNSLTTKLRIRAQLHTNDVAPTGNFTFGLYPITRPAVSGGAGLCIYTLGTVVSGSNGATFTAPAADGPPTPFAVGADFAIPADGLYCIGVVTTATVAASSHLHLTATLQQRNA